MGTHEPSAVLLRNVSQDDLPIFFEQQFDPIATQMAAFPARERPAFMAHWAKILDDATVIARTILFDGQVAGNVVSFEQSDTREVGYWIGRQYWGKGIATNALAALRVLEKCGFTIIGEASGESDASDEQVQEYMLKLSTTERRR